MIQPASSSPILRRNSRRTVHRLLALWLAFATLQPVAAQTGVEREQGLRDNTPRWHALTGATLVLGPGQVVTQGTLVLRDGLIVAAGASADVPVPAGARVWPLPGRTVYAGFIDLASDLAVPAALRPPPPGRPMFGPGSELPPPAGPRAEPRPMAARALASRNRSVRAEQDVAQQLEWKADDARPARELGFTAVLAAPAAGVFRGQSALLSTQPARDAKAAVISPRVAQHMGFETPNEGNTYPTSLMGAVALARQTLFDARWYAQASAAGGQERLQHNASLAALAPVLAGTQPVVLAAFDEQDYGRIAQLRDEFKLRAIVHGNGHEYRRALQLAAARLPVVVPLNYPAAPELGDPDSALDVSLATLQHWEQAPSNLALLQRAGVSFAVSAAGLREPAREFWPRLRQAVRRGLPASQALAALTTTPAALIGEDRRLGRLAPGQLAHVVVASGDLFTQDDAVVELTFVDGLPLPTEAAARPDLRGSWAVDASAERLQIGGTRSAPRWEGSGGPCELQPRGEADWVLRLPCARGADAASQRVLLATQRGERWAGTVQTGDGPLLAWSAQRVAAWAGPATAPPEAVAVASAASAAPAASAPAAAAGSSAAGPSAAAADAAAAAAPVSAAQRAADAAVPAPSPRYPAGAMGITAPEQAASLLLRNATVWTQGPAGTLAGADLLIQRGKIVAVGRNLAAPAGSQTVDASGKHISPGLIDAHSHIAMSRGINEFSHSVTAEVRVADALDATDIAIYRQLAGGLTTSHLLHGSANTIGGQSQLIKLRWGSAAQGLLFEGAKPTIKFALGENVKQSNWATQASRYPATRMGVEQVLRDSFAAAADYTATWRDWRSNPRGRPEPRRDLQSEALVEVLERRRSIHIHSYRADEILMFTRLAAELRLEVAAFQHVLEGYKVADAMAGIGAGASTFSDWWAYKMEVVDGVPANAAMMQRAGVLTSLNSDDAELGRRLNTEAAKAVRHGGLSEVEALALVTINPARQLHVDTRVGSLEPGKDADFVVWNGPPLSTYSRAEQTWIDGRRYFDIDDDRRLREADAAERKRLVTAALRAPRPPAGPRGRGDAPGPRPGPGDGGVDADIGAAIGTANGTAMGSDLGELRWRALLDQARAFRHAYDGQAAWHECTEDAR